MSLQRRLVVLERTKPKDAPRPDGRARGRMMGFLQRIAAAKLEGGLTEDLRAEMEAVRAAVRRCLDRGEAHR